MGLDAVELVMEVEEEFGISIPDEEASEIISVGDLYRIVMAHLPKGAVTRCLSAVTFYRFRRALMDQFGVGRREVAPATPMADLVHEEDRRTRWASLANSLNWDLPPLSRPEWMETAIPWRFWAGLLGVIIACGAAACLMEGALLFLVPLLVAASLVAAYMSERRDLQFANQFTGRLATVGGIVHAALAMNYDKIAERATASDPNEVWYVLKALIVRQLGVRPEDVIPAAQFVRDFGID